MAARSTVVRAGHLTLTVYETVMFIGQINNNKLQVICANECQAGNLQRSQRKQPGSRRSKTAKFAAKLASIIAFDSLSYDIFLILRLTALHSFCLRVCHAKYN